MQIDSVQLFDSVHHQTCNGLNKKIPTAFQAAVGKAKEFTKAQQQRKQD